MPIMWRYRELLRNLVYKEMKLTYCSSFLGLLWAMFIPFANIMVLWVVFGLIFKSQMENFVIYMITGILPWNLFSTSLVRSTDSIAANSSLLKNIYFPRLILPAATVAFQLVLFGMGFVVFLIVYFAAVADPSASLLLYPAALLLYCVFLLGIVFVVSAATVFFKDVRQIVEIAVYILFWSTPIVYAFSQIGGKVKTAIMLNPLTHFMTLFHDIVYWGRVPPLSTWGLCLAFSLAALFLGVTVFNGLERKFVEEL